MRQLVPALVLSLVATVACAFEIEDRVAFGPPGATQTLRILSTGDAELFAPVIERFLTGAPDVSVDYVVASSTEVMRALQDARETFDVAISSAMDLQTRLVNDGLARPHRSQATDALPDWARWRDHLFAFTEEPAAIILSRAAFGDGPVPRTRQDLIEALRADPDRFRGRVGTYDVRVSGLGYLFATQDARSSETFWRLSEVLGGLDVQLYCCSAQMIDDVVSGKLAMAYNVLGSYAAARADRDAFALILPEDYTLLMLRTALIPNTSRNPELAGRFIDALLARGPSGQGDRMFAPGPEPGSDTTVRRIPLGPGLLVFLDRFKKDRFIAEWRNAMVQD